MYTTAIVTIMVSDMDKAIAFYTGTLGFTLKNNYGGHWADIEAPGMAIGLHPAKEVKAGGNVSLGFGVSDFDGVVADLGKKGVVLQIKNDGMAKMALFSDPDGTSIYIRDMK